MNNEYHWSFSPFLNDTQDEDLAIIAAQQYYVEYGTEINIERLASLIPSYIPDHMIGGRGSRRDTLGWAKEVGKAFNKSYFSRERPPPHRVCYVYLSSLLVYNCNYR